MGAFALKHLDGGIDQLIEIVREDFAREADRDPFHALGQQQWKLHGQRDGLLFSPIIGWLPEGGLWIERYLQRKLGQSRFDVTRRGGPVACQNVDPIALSIDEQLALRYLHKRIGNRNISMRV